MPVPPIVAPLVTNPLLMLGLLIAGTFLMQSASNLFGSVTGRNPSAEAVATMMNTMVPLMISIMPMLMMMNMMTGMVNMMMQPFEALTRRTTPTYQYFA